MASRAIEVRYPNIGSNLRELGDQRVNGHTHCPCECSLLTRSPTEMIPPLTLAATSPGLTMMIKEPTLLTLHQDIGPRGKRHR